MTLVLASKSMSRRAMLAAAGATFETVSASVDEAAIRDALAETGISGRNLADALAEAKSLRGSAKRPDAMVLGCDSIVEIAKGEFLEKPETPDHAKAQLARLSGQEHSLFSAAVISENGSSTWRHVDRAKLVMRTLSDPFIDSYVERHWNEIRHCVGCYRLEAEGAQLFARIEGSHFTILGLPLLALLDHLRSRREMPA